MACHKSGLTSVTRYDLWYKIILRKDGKVLVKK